jgi:hypothetical protein
MESKEKAESKELIEGLLKEQTATRAIQKLNRKSIEISVYRHASLVDELAVELSRLNDELTQDIANESRSLIETKKSVIEDRLKELEKDKIEGVLTTLTYRDINDIKAAVTEALVHFKRYDFDLDVIMSRVVAEERYMTVFCALKQKGNTSIPYFSKLEDIAEIDDITIFDIFKKWEDHFVLSADELKN